MWSLTDGTALFLVCCCSIFSLFFAGPTEVNRMFAAAATSGGLTDNDAEALAMGMPQETIYQSLEKASKFEKVTVR